MIKFTAALIVPAILVQFRLLRRESVLRAIRSARSVASDGMLKRIASYRSQTHWIYAQPVIYAFHAGIPVPPQLAVLSFKRFWSGQMTWNNLLQVVQR